MIFAQVEGRGGVCAAARLLEQLSQDQIPARTSVVELETSAGLATSNVLRDGFSGQDLLKAADAALYRAKKAGRNRLVICGDDSEG